MKKTLLLTILIACILIPMTVSAQSWTGNMGLLLGSKMLEEDDWAPVEDHAEIGLLLDFGQDHWPVNLAIDFLASAKDDSDYYADYDVQTTEINIGVRKAWGDVLRPYIGGGLALISAKSDVDEWYYSYSEDDNGIGFWINGGLFLTLADFFNLGLDLRYSQAEVTLFGYDVEAGGTHAGIVLGFHW